MQDWEVRGHQFHIMRDGPFHITTILAGLWGGDNYINFTKAMEVRRRLIDVDVNQWKFYDQKILRSPVNILQGFRGAPPWQKFISLAENAWKILKICHL